MKKRKTPEPRKPKAFVLASNQSQIGDFFKKSKPNEEVIPMEVDESSGHDSSQSDSFEDPYNVLPGFEDDEPVFDGFVSAAPSPLSLEFNDLPPSLHTKQSSLTSFLPIDTTVNTDGRIKIKQQKEEWAWINQVNTDDYRQDCTEQEIESRVLALQALRKRMLEADLPLTKHCHKQNQFVFDRGHPFANLMIIGEAPGEEEARTGRPFVGRSGQKLNEMLDKIRIDVHRDIYVTNVVKVRPPHNRNPTFEEVLAYAPYLKEQIAIIQPKLILCLGGFATTVVKAGLNITDDMRGAPSENEANQYELRLDIMNNYYKNKKNLFPFVLSESKIICRAYASYHPSFILRNDKQKDLKQYKKNKARWDQDFLEVAHALLRPRLKIIDLEEWIGPTAEQTGFNDPLNDKFTSIERNLNPENYPPGQDLEFQVNNVDFGKWQNRITLYGRTREGHSVAAEVKNFYFKFYIYHPSFEEFAKPGRHSQWRLEFSERELNLHLKKEEKHQVKFELVQRRSYIHYHPTTSPHIQVKFEDHKDLAQIETYLNRTWPKCEYFEKNVISPKEKFLFDKDIWMYGWVSVGQGGFRRVVDDTERFSRCDLEFVIDYGHLVGRSPNMGDGEDKKWQDAAPQLVNSFDIEVLGEGGKFPTSDQDPIISISAYTQVYDDNILYEELRDKQDSTKTYLTSRSNYTDAVVFAVGKTNFISSPEFSPSFLPNIPEFPQGMKPRLAKGLKTTGEYKKKYTIAIRQWNEFAKKYKKWTTLVGRKRARLICNDVQLFDIYENFKIRPDGSDPKANTWLESDILAWESNVAFISDSYKQILSTDIEALERVDITSTAIVVDKTLSSEKQKEFLYGTIECRWSLFNPKKKVFSFKSEYDLLLAFHNFVAYQADPDMLVGYNNSNFDNPYIQDRALLLNVIDPRTGNIISFGRHKKSQDYRYVKESASKATGDLKYTVCSSAGRDVYDFFHYIQRDHKFDDVVPTKLGPLSMEVLGITKNDVPHTAIPALFKRNRERLCDYNLKDSELVIMLMNYYNNINYMRAMCRRIGTIPMGMLFIQGKQSWVFSAVMWFIRKEGLDKIMPDHNPYSKNDDEEDMDLDYTGAIVIDPTLGLLLQLLICFDYNSLYPSIIIALNLSVDVMGTAAHMRKVNVSLDRCHKSGEKSWDPISKSMQYFYFLKPRKLFKSDLDLAHIRVEKCYKNDKKMVNPETGVEEETYTPKLDQGAFVGTEKRFLALRAIIKAAMKPYQSTDIEYQKLDPQQLGVKIMANSGYGAHGVKTGKLACKAVAKETTFNGRKALDGLKTKIEAMGGKVHGGDTDSVFAYIPEMDTEEKIYEEVIHNGRKMTRMEKVLEYLNEGLPEGVKLAFEKVFDGKNYGVFQLAKKRGVYIVKMPFVDPITKKNVWEDKMTILYKGTDNKRRDSCKIAQEVLEGFVKRLLAKKSSEQTSAKCYENAQKYVKQEVEKILKGDIPYEYMIQSRQYSKANYKNNKVPVLQIIAKKRARGEPVPELGSRIPFIIVEGLQKAKNYELIEDPLFAISNNIPPNLRYIVDKKIFKPLKKYIDLLPEPQKAINYMFTSTYASTTHAGVIPDNAPLRRFAKTIRQCVGCGNSSLEIVCHECNPATIDWVRILDQQQSVIDPLNSKYQQCMQTCRDCMSLQDTDEIYCDNTSCPEYFPRIMSGNHLLKQQRKMNELRELANSI